MKLSLALLAAVSAMGATNTSLQFVPLSTNAAAIVAGGVVTLAAGNVAIFGAEAVSGCAASPYTVFLACDQTQAPLLTILNAAGTLTASLPTSTLGHGNSRIFAAAVDASGDVWITGTTNSDDFPLTHALYTQKTAYSATGFVAKLDPNLNILFSSFLGGQDSSTPAAIALDATGNAYIAGTGDLTFPQTGAPFGSAATAGVSYAFITKIASDGSKVFYSRLLGGSTSACSGGSACIGRGPYTYAFAIAVNGTGSVTVAGQTYTRDFPVTANVYNSSGAAFVSRISDDGSVLLWSTTVGIKPPGAPTESELSSIQAVALDSAANVYVAGSSYGPITATAGAVQSTYSTMTGQGVFSSGFVLKLSSDATQLLFATNPGGSRGSALSGLAFDSAANLWVTGFTQSPDFPGLSASTTAGLDFALELNANATAVEQIFPLLPQTVSQPPAFDTNGNLLLLATAGNLLRLNAATAYTAPAAFALTNSAVPAAVASIGSGEIMTVYGTGLGPSTGIVGVPDSTGYYPTTLGGVSIQIDGVLAPLLYAGQGQINFEAPPGLSIPSTITIVTPGGALPTMTFSVGGSIGIFGLLNSDGTVNSSTNPAKEGSIVSLYVTGLGPATSGSRDGAISTAASSAFMNLVEIQWPGYRAPLPLSYAGTAPGLIDGVAQINVQLPPGQQNPTLTVAVPPLYEASSGAVAILTNLPYFYYLLTPASASVLVYAQ